jgi:small-conductance mechanosensitive channel
MHKFALLHREYYGNPVSAYLWALAVFIGTLFGVLVARRLILARLRALAEKTVTDLDDFAVELIGHIRAPECYLAAAYLASRYLDLPARFDASLRVVVVVMVSYRVVTLLSATAGFAIRRLILADGADVSHQQTASTATFAAQCLIWAGAVLFVLGNLGFNVSSMIAGLGIGGIAVALAAQAVLGDLFSAVAIYLDKPFTVGDSIKVGDMSGEVEHIGIKTTRVRSVNGEMLVFPNSTLTSTRIQNFKNLNERRVLLSFSVPLSTPVETLRKIPVQVRAIVERTDMTRFERAHLASFRESGLEFEVVFFVTSTDYGVHMDRQQSVLLALLDALRADGIPLAQPTRTLLIERESKPA